MFGNLFELIQRHFPDPKLPFLDTTVGRCCPYGELEEASGRYARLLSNIGVIKGDRVMVQTEKSPESLFLYLACLRTGAIWIPIDPAYTKPELLWFLNDAKPSLLVCMPPRYTELWPLAMQYQVKTVMTLSSSGEGSLIKAASGINPDTGCVATDPDDVAAILYTSGTTGQAKGAMLSHRNLAVNALTLTRIWGFRADDILIHALPIHHTHGLFVAVHCTLLAGARMLYLPRFDTNWVIDLLPKATVLMGVPTFYTRLLDHPGLTESCCRSMRLFISGSAPLLEDTFHTFLYRTGHTILERYGMTETGMIASNPLDGERRAGTVGLPLPNVEVRVTGRDGRTVSPGEIGAIELRGENVFRGYWRQSEKTTAEFRSDGFFVTGDLGKVDKDGYIRVLGRSKDMIITGGLNVYPKEIENLINELNEVEESAVIGVPHPDYGEAVVAMVKLRPGLLLAPAAIIEGLREQLAPYKLPKRIVYVDELPRNTMGKVQKTVLRQYFQENKENW
jgi:malonyl-CoA/methylmalonyl-CoA synthetase